MKMYTKETDTLSKNGLTVFLFLVFAVLTASKSFAQNPTDLCSSAPTLSVVGGTACNSTGSFSVPVPAGGGTPETAIGSNTLANCPSGIGIGNDYEDYWYKLTGTGSTVSITFSSPGNVPFYLAAYPGTSCPPATGTQLTCHFGGSPTFGAAATISFPTTAGVTYYIQVELRGTASSTLNCTTSNCNILLPIELLNFTATCNNDEVLLSWSTVTEHNNKEFELERSEDAIHYQTIAMINGSGNTTAPKNYAYQDYNPAGIRYYYRLKQVDFDGTTAYYSTVVTYDNACVTAFGEVSLYPNPANDVLTVALGNNNSVKVEIINDSGQQLYVSESTGTNQVEINTALFAAGIYAVRVSNQYKTVVKKLSVNH